MLGKHLYSRLLLIHHPLHILSGRPRMYMYIHPFLPVIRKIIYIHESGE